jgi:hypothetical protein
VPDRTLALWLRAQRAYQAVGLKPHERPLIKKTNIVCAEPMPGEIDMLREFTADLTPKVLGQLVEVIFEKMKLGGEAGSLLKIEDEIRDAVEEAKAEYQRELQRRQDEQSYLPGMAPLREPTLFDDLTDDEFWTRAEDDIAGALELYARQAENGKPFQRRLFADDMAQGFAFVHVCRQRFDVVLMNPPFGEASRPSKALIDICFPRTKNDVYAAFVERGLQLLQSGGMLGAITSRTGFFLSSFQRWREGSLLQEAQPTVFADLGYGVLDTAMVETAAYCLAKARTAI